MNIAIRTVSLEVIVRSKVEDSRDSRNIETRVREEESERRNIVKLDR